MSRTRCSKIAGFLTATSMLVCGCNLFDNVEWMETTEKSGGLKPIQPSIDTVQVEVFYAERPANDPLLGDILWDNVDESGALDHATREIVNRNGFRVGIVGADPPQALQTLLGLSTESDARNLNGRRIGLFTGTTTEVQTSPDYETCSISFLDREDSLHEQEFQNARCVLRLKAERFQPGWARLEFQPEIHHGENRLRHQAGENGWQLRTTQNVKQMFSQTFEVTLNQAEMVIITQLDDAESSVGRHFFNHGDPPDQKQRILVVRLGTMNKTVGQRTEPDGD